MTKKDFELIAGVLRDTEAITLKSHWDAVWKDRDRLAEAFADALATTNPRFDRERFIAAATGAS